MPPENRRKLRPSYRNTKDCPPGPSSARADRGEQPASTKRSSEARDRFWRPVIGGRSGRRSRRSRTEAPGLRDSSVAVRRTTFDKLGVSCAPVPGSRCRCADYANRIEAESATTVKAFPTVIEANGCILPAPLARRRALSLRTTLVALRTGRAPRLPVFPIRGNSGNAAGKISRGDREAARCVGKGRRRRVTTT